MIIGIKDKNDQIYFCFLILIIVKLHKTKDPNIDIGNAKNKYQL